MKKIAFRTMGGKRIGYGHIYRCLSLAKAIRKKSFNYEIIFIVNQEVESLVRESNFELVVSNYFQEDMNFIKEMHVDLFILDSYEANNLYLKSISNFVKLMLFDDNNNIYDARIPDIILNGNIHAENLEYRTDNLTHLLIGPSYLVMQEGYWDIRQNENNEKKGLLLTTGGADKYDISPKLLKAAVETDFDITVIVGPGFSNKTISELNKVKNNKTTIVIRPNGLQNYIKNSEYVVTAAGSTVYEVLSQKSIPIIFSTADNQEIAYSCFEKFGIQTIGKYPNISYEKLLISLDQINKKDIARLWRLIDGRGVFRALEQIEKIING